jgi:hypothetical protein
VAVTVLRRMSSAEVQHAVDGFSPRYVADWDAWLRATPASRPRLFAEILRRWQACRPRPMRRIRTEATHGPPYVEDLIRAAEGHLVNLGSLTVANIGSRSEEQERALKGLWSIFSNLTTIASATCVGISKAVLLSTFGRIGPALDSNVLAAIEADRPVTAQAWLRLLDQVSADIAAFEAINGPLRAVVPARFAGLEYGRLYDMALGPR